VTGHAKPFAVIEVGSGAKRGDALVSTRLDIEESTNRVALITEGVCTE
jgi:hypothetical protein